MQDFGFLNYNTEYSCKGEFYKDMEEEACFGFVFNRISKAPISEEYNIILYKGTKLSRVEHKSNACLFNKQQIRNHLKQAHSIYPFRIHIEELEWEGYPAYKVQLKLKDVPGNFHAYLLTWLRYMYEYPYNVILLDTYKLKKDPIFRFTSISNLFNLVLSCFNDNPREIHQIPRNQINVPLQKKDIRTKLKQIKLLNNIYKKLQEKSNDTIPDRIGNLTTYDIEYWEPDNLFEIYRKPIYMNVYQKIIKKK